MPNYWEEAALLAPKVSVIVTTWNRPSQLRLCIEALRQQIYLAYEIIVTEDGPEQKVTQEMSQDLGFWYLTHPRTLDHNGEEIWDEPRSINSAVAVAIGDIVQILQDDFIIPPDFLLWLVRSIDKSSIIYPSIEYTTHDRFSLHDLDAMLKFTHLPDRDPRFQFHALNGRRHLMEFTEWGMAEGVGWAFPREAWVDIDPHFVGYGYGEQDWALRQRLRGYHLYVQPMMRAWLRNWPDVVHPTEKELVQNLAHQEYMKQKWGDNVFTADYVLPPMPFGDVQERVKQLRERFHA